MNNKLTSVAIAAALISSSTVAIAEEPTSPQPAERHPQQTKQRQEAQEREKVKEDARRFGEAVGSATTTAATQIAEVTGELTRAADRPDRYNTVAIEVNPLGLLVGGRISLNVEYAPVTHHVIVASPHFVRTTSTVEIGPTQTIDQSFTGFGGEIGYRYYTGHNGMNGIFVGPSIIGGVYNAAMPGGDTAFTNIGVAADIGYQQVLMDHLALGAGVGVEYLHVSEEFHDLPTGPSTIASSGLKPRLLAQVGYAF